MAYFEANQALRWHDDDWIETVVEWIDAHVERTGDVEQVHAYPWATAIRVPTASGTVWFKACIEELAHEVTTLEVIGARRPELVPRLVAGDRANGWMLLEDAGERMRELESQGGQLERWEEAVPLYAQLQLDVARDADVLVSAGVPDRRARVAEQLAAVIEDERVTKPTPETALDDDELERLRALVARIAGEEAELDALGVPYSVQHDDLHDANIFVRDGGYRIIDWGDACVANPLLSLTVALAVVAYRFGVDATAPEVVRVRDAYLEPFTAVAAREELGRAAELATRLGYACGTLKWYDVMTATAGERELPERLRSLLELCG